jgi:hypothetical protein
VVTLLIVLAIVLAILAVVVPVPRSVWLFAAAIVLLAVAELLASGGVHLG